jgi:hypothetical protein
MIMTWRDKYGHRRYGTLVTKDGADGMWVLRELHTGEVWCELPWAVEQVTVTDGPVE